MCHRISPLLIAELREALAQLQVVGRARVPRRDASVVVPDAYPGQQLPLILPDGQGGFEPALLTWGFDASQGSRSRLVFNTRLDTALSQARSGRGLWAEAIGSGRCLVPVRSFYESWTRSTEDRRTQVRFTFPGHQVFLLAGVSQGGRFSVVTTEPNASVAPIHSRMPLVLGPGESGLWLAGDFAALADRSGIALEAVPEAPPRGEMP